MKKEFKIKRIIVPTDYSATASVALDHAIDMAKKFGASLALIHVLEEGAYAGIFSPSEKTEYVLREKAQLHLQEEANKLEKKHGIHVSQEVRSGRIYDQIIEATKEADGDLIIMGTHGVAGWAEFFVGSNAFRVVTQSACPVLSIQGYTKGHGFKHIILPLDRTPETRQKVRYAAALAKKYGSTIHLGAMLLEDTPEIRFDFEKKVKQITDYLDREEIAHEENILIGENLATMAMNYAESKKGDLMVIMTEQEYNLTGFLVGPYAQQIVNHCRIPVLSISPEEGKGFTFH
ncbi:MAG: universal stress protein [Flavobacteriales bacterium]|nr:universal stress protein [Flavobacteriales bacterium]